jgi:hypothetical protein
MGLRQIEPGPVEIADRKGLSVDRTLWRNLGGSRASIAVRRAATKKAAWKAEVVEAPSNFTYPSMPYFVDVTASNNYFPWIQRLKQDNITGGCSATSYCSGSAVIRGDMAIFVMRGAFNQFLPAGTPLITAISPSTLALGATGTYTITGSHTSFVQGTTLINPIPGVMIGTITVNSATSLTVQLTAAANAVTQPYSILAITGSEQAVLPNGLVLQ